MFICEHPALAHYHENGLSPLLIRRVSVVINVFIQTHCCRAVAARRERGTRCAVERRRPMCHLAGLENSSCGCGENRKFINPQLNQKNQPVGKTKHERIFSEHFFCRQSHLRPVKYRRLLTFVCTATGHKKGDVWYTSTQTIF